MIIFHVVECILPDMKQCFMIICIKLQMFFVSSEHIYIQILRDTDTVQRLKYVQGTSNVKHQFFDPAVISMNEHYVCEPFSMLRLS